MGKVIFFITAIIVIDILLLATGQLCIEGGTGVCGLSSIVFNAIINLSHLQFSQFFTEIIGDFVDLRNSATGFTALLTAIGVTIGAYIVASSEQRLFIPIAMTLGIIAGDFVFLFSGLGINPLLGTLIIAPLAMAFILSVLDWIRGKD